MKIKILCVVLLLSLTSHGKEFPDNATLGDIELAMQKGDPNCQHIYLDVLEHSLVDYNTGSGQIIIQAPKNSPILKLSPYINNPRYYTSYNVKNIKRFQGTISVTNIDKNNDVLTYDLSDNYPIGDDEYASSSHIPPTTFKASFVGFTSGHPIEWGYDITLKSIKEGYAGNIKAIGCTSAAFKNRTTPAKCDSKTFAVLDKNSQPMFYFSDMKNCQNALNLGQKGLPSCDDETNTLVRADMSFVHNKFSSANECTNAAKAMAQNKPFCVTGIHKTDGMTFFWWDLLNPNGLDTPWSFELEKECTDAANDSVNYPTSF